MKQFLILVFIFSGLFGFAQVSVEKDTCNAEIIESIEVWEYNHLVPLSDSKEEKDRVATWRNTEDFTDLIFFSLLVFSFVMLILFLNSRHLIVSVFKSLFNLQYTLQSIRTDRQSNNYYYFFYLIAYLIGTSFIFSNLPSRGFSVKFSFISLLLIIFSYFVLDYISTFIYTFFTNKRKIVDVVQSVLLSYSIFYGLLVWPALFLILLTSLSVSKFFLLVFIGLCLLILFLKEFRVFQILWIEKLDIFSFHFFAYLCTFKILPIALLIKFVLY